MTKPYFSSNAGKCLQLTANMGHFIKNLARTTKFNLVY